MVFIKREKRIKTVRFKCTQKGLVIVKSVKLRKTLPDWSHQLKFLGRRRSYVVAGGSKVFEQKIIVPVSRKLWKSSSSEIRPGKLTSQAPSCPGSTTRCGRPAQPGDSESTTVTSHTKVFPRLQGTEVIPSGLFPSLTWPFGSKHDITPADASVLFINNLTSECLLSLDALFCKIMHVIHYYQLFCRK